MRLFLFVLFLFVLFVAGCCKTSSLSVVIVNSPEGASVSDVADCQVPDTVWLASDGHLVKYQACIPNQSGRHTYFVRYTNGPHQGEVYKVHYESENEREYLLRNDQRVYFGAGCVVPEHEFVAKDGYWMVYHDCKPNQSGGHTYFVQYTNGPHQGEVYEVHYDNEKEYILRDDQRVYLR